ncbi:MAG: hypothetical protein GY859_42935, partial [Desulfobacterales bacterium]|nr:hypothetical protein [Desulfobacterales bacterium]
TYLVGRIFHDENASLTLDFGEEAAGGRVELRPLHIPDAPTEEAPVDAAGSYQIEIAPFTPHQLVVYDQEDARIYETTIGAAAGANTRYDIALEGLDSPAEGAVSAGRASGSQKSDSWFFIRTGEEMKNVVFAR